MNTIEGYSTRRLSWSKRGVALGLTITLSLLLITFWLTRAPVNFPVNEPLVVEKGLSASAIADLLEESDVVRSSGLFYTILLFFYDPSIQAGTYIFNHSMSIFAVANHLVNTTPLPDSVSLTLPEGFTAEEFAKIASQSDLENFDPAEFAMFGIKKEGFLFPDTYYVPKSYTANDLIVLLEETYQDKSTPLKAEIKNHPLGEYGIITLASLIEREAKDEESMRMVAGILLNRLNNDMRLQVDASLEYVLEGSLSSLTADDLELDSPYNTYLYDGLPPTPIGNPGLMSIEAVLNPIESEYLYYITDEEGKFHYAKTFDEHTDNIAKYL